MSEKIDPAATYVSDDEGNILYCEECSQPLETSEFRDLSADAQATFLDDGLCPECFADLSPIDPEDSDE